MPQPRAHAKDLHRLLGGSTRAHHARVSACLDWLALHKIPACPIATTGIPVPGAPLKASLKLCGTMFGLQTPCGAELRRHRYFETSFLVMQPECRHGASVLGVYGGHVRDRCRTVGVYGEGCRDVTSDPRRKVIGVYGHSYNKSDKRRTITVTGHTPQQNVERNRVRNTYTVDDARAAMGMPWATIAGLSQAIPPAYSEHIGRYAMMALAATPKTGAETHV